MLKQHIGNVLFKGVPTPLVRRICVALNQNTSVGLASVAGEITWEKSKPLPKILRTTGTAIFKDRVDIVTSTEWIFWYGNKVEIASPKPDSGKYTTSNGNEIHYYDYPPMTLPEGVTKAAKVVFGAYTNTVDGSTYGVHWELYRD